MAVRPLATVMTGVVEVLGPLSRRTPAPLLRGARAGLRALEMDPLLRLSGFRSGKREVPEFLGPDLTIGPSSCLDEDLQRLRAISERTIRADLGDFLALDDPTDLALRWADDPDRELARLC